MSVTPLISKENIDVTEERAHYKREFQGSWVEKSCFDFGLFASLVDDEIKCLDPETK